MERKPINGSTYLFFATASYLLLMFSNQAAAQDAPTDTSYYPLFEKALEKYHNEEYEEAIRLSLDIRKQYPDVPAGVFGLMTTYQTLMRNYRVRLYESKMDSLLDLAIDMSKKAINKSRNPGLNYFYLGCAYGSRSIYHARRGKWLDAFKDGTNVRNSFEQAIKHDPDFYDAYYGLGLYNYWLGAKARFFGILSFTKNKKAEGLEEIKLAVKKGRFLQVDSMYGLTSAYYNEGEFEKALEISDSVYASYPHNPSLLYRRGRILQELKRWEEACETFADLHNLLVDTKYQSISFQVECLYQMARSYYELGNHIETYRLCQEAIALDKKCDFSKELNGPIDKYEDIQDQLFKLNKKVDALRLTRK